ncbi:MAG TPA: FHA domain-containing protein [Kofleriaceae bacterium]|nr:FHA domain-containing protein [Kofleriaceae bacterium]
MTVCNRCGKENQDHYKFCLGCGAELTAAPKAGGGDVGMMKTMMADPSHAAPIPGGPMRSQPLPQQGGRPPGASGGMPGMPPAGPLGPIGGPAAMPPPMGPPPGVPFSPGGYGAPAPAPVPQAAGGVRRCPSCASDVPPSFRFCGTCGFRMDEGSNVAPMPMPPGPAMAAPQPQRSRLSMTLIRPDGTEGGTHQLQQGENKLGRSFGPVFENDGYLSPIHAQLDIRGVQGVVRDLDSLNGVFVKMVGEEELQSGQILRVGQELLRFELIAAPEPTADGTELMGSPNPGYWGKLTVIIGRDITGAAFPLLGESVTLGRERGEINFPDDGYVSGLHARISLRDGRVFLTDLGSSNGSFVKVNGERAVGHESFVLLGQQLFRLNFA